MRSFDPRAWVVWLLAGGLLALSTRNPLYLLLLLVIARVVHSACAVPGAAALRLPFWRLAGAILLFSTLFNLLTAHGLLHLLGFDHAEPDEKQEMFELQRQLLLTFLAGRGRR